jgi:hypothetical protein
MTQLSLFDDGPQLARQSDPVTSQAAAEEVRPKVGKLQEAFLTALKDLGGIRTAREVGERAREMGLHGDVESVRKRSTELERLRFIELAELRRCPFTGKLCEGWRVCE